jgi:5-methylcytosine-specific restriction endonuclease McrA
MSSLCPLIGMRVLLLNSSYEPIKIISWQRAMLLWLADKVDVLDHHEYEIRSVSNSYALPSIIRVRQYVRQKRFKKNMSFSRGHIFLRDNHQCQYCGGKFKTSELTLDHILPATRGGPRTWENLTSACKTCNQKKGSRTPDEAQMPLLNPPTSLPRHYLPDLLLLRKNIPSSWMAYLQQASSQ